MRKLVAVLGTLFVLPASAWAADVALPAAVAKALQEQVGLCSEAGGKPTTTFAVRRTDLNADGKQDFVLDVGSIQCEGAASIFGDREKAVQVFLGDGADGAELSFSGSTFAVKLEGAGAAARVWLTLTGDECGKERAAMFSDQQFCDRPLTWNEKTKKIELAPVSAAKIIH